MSFLTVLDLTIAAYSSCVHLGDQNITTDIRLVDTLMVPFQTCYLLIYVLMFPMLAGNQLLPLFLLMEVLLLSKVVRTGSELEVSLHFILTHSRR